MTSDGPNRDRRPNPILSTATSLIRPLSRRGTRNGVAVYALACGVYAALPVWKEMSVFADVADLPAEFHAALTLVLGWLLVFRTNTAYDRWWEARTLWGALVNSTRNLALKLSRLVVIPPADLLEARRALIAFPYGLRDHLRSECELRSLPGFESDESEVEHVPAYLVRRVYDVLARATREGEINGDELRVIDAELRRYLDICGGCERIYKTRVARSYRVFARQCIFLFLITLPWGIAHDFGYWTIPLTIITAYFMIGLETVAEHVEEPFGYDEDDLDLDGLCETMDRSVQEIIPGV
jgi:putative membrane protein